jgi:hypothetical protein
VLQNGAPAGKDFSLGTWQPISGAQWQANTEPDDLQLITSTPVAVQNVRNGDRITIELLWEGNPRTPLPPLTLRDTVGRWEITVPPLVNEHDAVVLDWRTFQIPIDAISGEAVLQTPSGEIVARYMITDIPMETDAPIVENSANITFDGVGTVLGYEYTIQEDALEVILVWRAANNAPTQLDYTVFVQVLNSDGQLAAQSDAKPATNTRPTFGWRANEIIIDVHTLPLNTAVNFERGTLILGLYDSNGVRFIRSDATDFATLGGISR